MFAPVVGEETWAWLTGDSNPGLGRIVSGLLGEVVAHLDDGVAPPCGGGWPEVLAGALAIAWEQASAAGGANPAEWRWGETHRTASRNPLSSVFPDAALDPPSASVGGDADTIRCAGYGISGKRDFVITSTSVYRQVVDFADLDNPSFVIPGGVSGDSTNAHFADQLPIWEKCERIPMNRLSGQAAASAVSELSLKP